MSVETTSAPASDGGTGVNYLVLAVAMWAGALAWLIRLVANSSLVVLSCRIGSAWPLWAVTAACTAVAVGSGWLAWRFHRAAGTADEIDAARWLGLLGVMFNALAVAGIALESAPIAFIDICRAVPGA